MDNNDDVLVSVDNFPKCGVDLIILLAEGSHLTNTRLCIYCQEVKSRKKMVKSPTPWAGDLI
jgi:hypothetical protein